MFIDFVLCALVEENVVHGTRGKHAQMRKRGVVHGVSWPLQYRVDQVHHGSRPSIQFHVKIAARTQYGCVYQKVVTFGAMLAFDVNAAMPRVKHHDKRE